MLPNQIGSIIRAVLPVATIVGFLVAHGFTADEAQIIIDSAVSLVVAAAMAAWGFWKNRPQAVVNAAADLPLRDMPKADVASLVAKVESLQKPR